MSTDVRLDEGSNKTWVTVDAGALNVKGSDLLLDSTARRGGKKGNFRRALVHDQGDRLSVNFNRDYSGGVSINDARVNVHCEYQGGQPLLPKHGQVGDLLATSNVYRLDGVPIGQSVTLWLCVGSQLSVAIGGAVSWVPLTTGKAVIGSV